MTYDELVKQLRNRRICIQQLGTLNDYPLLGEAADAIEELSKREADMSHNMAALSLKVLRAEEKIPRWIPVTERLPEPFENVLVANKRGKHYDIDKGWWNGSFFDRCAKGGYHNVTHWMPLPEPPKEGNE